MKYRDDNPDGYRLSTSNGPFLGDETREQEIPSYLKDWGEPTWEIYQLQDGAIEIHVNRPTTREVMEGDLHGETFGSVIKLEHVSRLTIGNGLRLARKLCKCAPQGILIDAQEFFGIKALYSCIPVAIERGAALTPPPAMRLIYKPNNS